MKKTIIDFSPYEQELFDKYAAAFFGGDPNEAYLHLMDELHNDLKNKNTSEDKDIIRH